jgi:integrase/recombinase XerC
MMDLISQYISYIRNIRRYSERTALIYEGVLKDYAAALNCNEPAADDSELLASLNCSEVRSYEVKLLDERKLSAKTVNLHMSVLSGFCKYLVKQGHLQSNPVSLVSRPKIEKRVPEFYRFESMEEYFRNTEYFAGKEDLEAFLEAPQTKTGKKAYEKRLARLIISLLYGLGIRRSELVGMTLANVDFGRNVVKIHGKGDKMREIPILKSLCEEILLYLKAVEALCGRKRSLTEPLLVTYGMNPIYPVYVDRAVKSELGDVKSITGRKSPHVLRHSIATELLNEGSDLNSIKEMLGHSSLATTQVYTHSSIAQLKNIYEQAHPRAKNGGKHGD